MPGPGRVAGLEDRRVPGQIRLRAHGRTVYGTLRVWFTAVPNGHRPHSALGPIFHSLDRMTDWLVGLMDRLGAPGAGLAIALENLFFLLFRAR
ncbi:hypothetical protein GCM10020001_105920 [Nonomuraea salmonea]